MVHVKTCPLVLKGKSKRRGMASTEFYINGVPQIYCNGFMSLTGEPLKECRECLDWARGDQVARDMKADEIKLKPCPFCGGKASVLKAYRVVHGFECGLGTAYTVACETERCVLEGGGGLFDSEYSAIKAWNRRCEKDE